MKKLLFILSVFFCLESEGQSPMYKLTKKRSSFIPSDISGLKLWVKADQIGGLSDGDPVSTWSDQSGVSNDLTAAGGVRPTYQTNELNSLPIVRFDGTDDVMNKSSPSGVTNQAGLTIFLVAKQASLATNNVYLTVWDYNTQGCWAWQTGSVSSSEVTAYIADGITDAGSNHNQSNGAGITSAFYVLGMVYDGSQGTASDRVKFYVNGTVQSNSATGTLPTTLTNASADLRLGQFGGSLTRNFNGDFAEVVIYNSALGTTDRDNVINYLRTKWNVY